MSKLTEFIRKAVTQRAVFYCSHSAGKDSQAMHLMLRHLVPESQLVVVHADLGRVEWDGVQDHIRDTAGKFSVVRAGKTFFDMVRHRKMFPSSCHRQCTSDLKRGPIYKFIRNDMNMRGATLGINCVGLRAEESTARARKDQASINKTLTNSKRIVWDLYPILHWSTSLVFDFIEANSQKPHPAYKWNPDTRECEGNTRLSCMFCIMGSKRDLRHAAEQNPGLYREYIELEQEVGHTMFSQNREPISLEDYVGIPLHAL